MYQLNVDKPCQVFLKIHQHITTASSLDFLHTVQQSCTTLFFVDEQKSFHDDIMLFIVHDTGQVVAFTDKQSSDVCTSLYSSVQKIYLYLF